MNADHKHDSSLMVKMGMYPLTAGQLESASSA